MAALPDSSVTDFAGVRRNFDALVARLGVAGIVDGATGTLLAGSGFTATRVSAGVYDVVYRRRFARLPTVSVTPATSANVLVRLSVLTPATTEGCRVVIADTAAVGTDADFHFRATG